MPTDQVPRDIKLNNHFTAVLMVICHLWIGFAAYQEEENEEAYRDESSRQEEQRHDSDYLCGHCLCFCLTGNVLHFMRDMLHFCGRFPSLDR